MKTVRDATVSEDGATRSGVRLQSSPADRKKSNLSADVESRFWPWAVIVRDDAARVPIETNEVGAAASTSALVAYDAGLSDDSKDEMRTTCM